MAALFIAFANRQTAAEGGRDLSSILPFGVTLFAFGLLSFFQVQAAYVVIAIAAFAVGMWLVVGSLLTTPFPWLLINIAIGALLAFPAIWWVRLLLRQRVAR